MKLLIVISRIIVGILFIISGLIKLNDPIGFSFKLEEYFSTDVLNMEFLVPYALIIAIILVIFEVLLGVMLLLGYAKKFTTWCLLLMILFFCFLTFYSAYYNKVTDCGCFGDALKLTPWQSFSKDVVLLLLILLLFFGRKYIVPFFTRTVRSFTVITALVFCLGIAYYVLEHLPIIDFRPYKIGNNISEKMTVPDDAPKPKYDYEWTFDVNGTKKTVTTNGVDPMIDGELLSVDTHLVQEGYVPPIHDFSIEREESDYTEHFLNRPNLIVVVAYNMDAAEKDGFVPIREITDEAIKKGYTVIGLSSSAQQVTEQVAEKYRLNFKFYFCDETTLKTIIRSNPGIMELQSGTIKQKLHFNDAKSLKLAQISSVNALLDLDMKRRLDSISELDQKYRTLMRYVDPSEREIIGKQLGMTEAEYNSDLWQFQNLLDSANMAYVEGLFQTVGYPGKSLVGEPTNTVAWVVLQHNPDKIEKYFHLVKKSAEAGELSFTLAAMMEDRFLMQEGKAQIYGTQGRTDSDGMNYIWPLENPEKVNKLRADAGFEQTVKEYAKSLFGENFVYKEISMNGIKQG